MAAPLCMKEEDIMLKAYRGNRVLRIPEEKKKDYIALGYRITDMDGKVLHDPVDNTDNVKVLKDGLQEKDKTIAELNGEIKALNQKVAELESAVAEKDKTIADLNAKIAESEKAAKKSTSSGKATK